MKTLKSTLKELKAIEKQALELEKQMQRENAIYRAELKERLQLGLTGEAAIKHYNEFMTRYNMPHLKVN